MQTPQPRGLPRNYLEQTVTDDAAKVPSGAAITTALANIVAQGTFTYYFQNTASDVGTYKKALIAPYAPKTTLTYTPGNGTNVLINFITEPGSPGLAAIPAGQYQFHVHASKTGGAFTVYGELWETDASGVDIAKIGTTAQAVTTSSEVQYQLLLVNANTYSMTSATSRIALRVYAIVTGAASCNIFVGEGSDSFFSFPSSTVDASNFVAQSAVNSADSTLAGGAAKVPTDGMVDQALGNILSSASGPVSVLSANNRRTYVATAAVQYNLPTGDLSSYCATTKSPLQFTFVKTAAGTLTINPGSGNYIANGAAAATLADSVAGETYATVTVRLISSAASVNKWVIVGAHGTWTPSA